MAHQLVLSKQFEKAYKKFAGKNQLLRANISKALEKLANNPNDPSLRTHKLSGKLAAYLACYCGYDCRIIFIIEKDITNPTTENILLLDIGTHDDVY
jgi:mRNA-degrading endonuclease YafQ of YafQ-DinJ toxin-antitoxin module